MLKLLSMKVCIRRGKYLMCTVLTRLTWISCPAITDNAPDECDRHPTKSKYEPIRFTHMDRKRQNCLQCMEDCRWLGRHRGNFQSGMLLSSRDRYVSNQNAGAFVLAHTHICPQGCTKNSDRAAELYFRASQDGHIGALYNLVSGCQQPRVWYSNFSSSIFPTCLLELLMWWIQLTVASVGLRYPIYYIESHTYIYRGRTILPL